MDRGQEVQGHFGGTLRPLRHRSFRRYWVSQSVSAIGNRVYAVALPFLIFELGGEAREVGNAFTAFSVPQLLFLLFGGVAVDRLPRRLLLVGSDLVRLAVLAAAVVLLWNGELRIPHVYLMAGLFGVASAFFQPASFSIVPELLPKEELAAGNSLRAFSQELAGVLGPPVGGALIAAWGVAFALSIDLLTFLAGAGLLLMLPGTGREHSGEEERFDFRRELIAGFGYVASSTWLWFTILVFSAINVFLSGAISIVLPVVAEASLGGAQAFGWLLSAMATGALAASLFVGYLARLGRRGLSAYLGVAISGVCLLLFATGQAFATGLAIMFVLGASLVVFGVIWESTVQELVPPNMLGRVISIDMLGSFGLLPFGYLLLGRLVETHGSTDVLFACGALTVTLALSGLLVPAIRRLD